jgi:hypothetical protein
MTLCSSIVAASMCDRVVSHSCHCLWICRQSAIFTVAIALDTVHLPQFLLAQPFVNWVHLFLSSGVRNGSFLFECVRGKELVLITRSSWPSTVTTFPLRHLMMEKILSPKLKMMDSVRINSCTYSLVLSIHPYSRLPNWVSVLHRLCDHLHDVSVSKLCVVSFVPIFKRSAWPSLAVLIWNCWRNRWIAWSGFENILKKGFRIRA